MPAAQFLGLGFELVREPAKRKYKVFNNPHSVKGPVAACLLMASGWEPGQSLLDPFTSGGTIAIEAALMSTGTSLHFYDKQLACFELPVFTKKAIEEADKKRKDADSKLIFAFDARLPNVTAAKKNAKIAGVDKSLTFSKMDVEWIDTKMAAASVDRIVTQPIEASKHIREDRAKKLHQDLFYQADYALKPKGKMTFICHKPAALIAAAQQYGFKPESQELIHTGHLALWVLVMTK